VERLQKNLNPYKPEDRMLLRKLTEGNIIELDTNDRLLIPAEQKSRIGNAKDIVLISLGGNFIEIWDHDKYNQMEGSGSDTEYVSMASDKLGNLSDSNKVE
jgi:DNA-binding transcriptional regulator/RsmH inhibitor MraZ